MAGNQQDEGTSKKSERTDSSLSRRLRSLAKQALPPDPYSHEGSDNAVSTSKAAFELDSVETEETPPEPTEQEPIVSSAPPAPSLPNPEPPPGLSMFNSLPEPWTSQAAADPSPSPVSSMPDPPAPPLPGPAVPSPDSPFAPALDTDAAEIAAHSVAQALETDEIPVEAPIAVEEPAKEEEESKPRRKRRRPARQYTNVPEASDSDVAQTVDEVPEVEKSESTEVKSEELEQKPDIAAEEKESVESEKEIDAVESIEEIEPETAFKLESVEEEPPAKKELEPISMDQVNEFELPKKEKTQAPVVTRQTELSLSAPSASSSAVPEKYWTDTENRQKEAVELLKSIDEALGICAMNMSSLQQASHQQSESFNQFKDTLQNQTFFELGLNLNTLMESLSAALEPMKAVGELVPSIDQLVQVLEEKAEIEQEKRLTPDELVTALADQLANGQIDPWTFKCAYMAVYPDEHPADLLRRLVDSLGTQRLPGDLFRAAYEAIQAAEAPPSVLRGVSLRESIGAGGETLAMSEELASQLDELKRSNEELRQKVDTREEEINKRLEERETEYSKLLDSKEQELEEIHNTMKSRLDEFNTQYDEMVEAIKQREEELHNKDSELNQKESEISQLKAQLDELQEQFTDTVGDLQKQLTSTMQAAEESAQKAVQKPEEPKPKTASSFFDTSEPKTPLLDNSPSRSPLQQQMETFKNMSKPVAPPAPAPTPPVTPTQPINQMSAPSSPPTTPLPEPSKQAVPSSTPTTPSLPGSQGIYSNGVRTQVFEVIVRQALAGAPWREICAGPMQVNNISPDEVEAEVKRRQALLNK